MRNGYSVAFAFLIAATFAGCNTGGAPETPSHSEATSTGTQTSSAEKPPTQGQAPARPDLVDAVTPNRMIDTESVVAVVKGEVSGGEAKRGPSEENTFWLFPDESKIQDEPYVATVPKGLPELTPGNWVPLANPLTKGKVELGRQLYFDPRVSKDGTVSCATCHNPEKGWTDQMPVSAGIGGQLGGRSAPTVLNTAYGRIMFWDGRALSLEAQAQGPIQNEVEMGKQSYEEIVNRLREIPGYREQFEKVFGTDVTLDGMAKAIATFERVAALSGDSAYDRYRDPDNPDRNKALTDSQKRGMVLFGERLNDDDEFQTDVVLQKAMCTRCHVGFNFTDDKFHNLGVGYDPSTGKFKDLGRFAVAPIGGKDPADIGAFKTPTLRDLEHTAPYMHDGSEDTLEAVVEYYNKGGIPNPYLDPDIKPLNLTDQEKADVVAFLKALNGNRPAVELPTLPPGPDGTAPDPRAALQTPTRKVAAEDDAHGAFVR